MLIENFDGETDVRSVSDLQLKLQTERRGEFGAFTLIGGNDTSLCIMINADFAFLYFHPDSDGTHPGYEPEGMTPSGCPQSVFVLQATGTRADGFDIPAEHIVSLEDAYRAAQEYFQTEALPPSITWLEL